MVTVLDNHGLYGPQPQEADSKPLYSRLAESAMTQTYETAMNPFTGNLRGNRSHGVVHDWIATSQQDADDADDAGDIEASDAAKREGVVGSYDDLCAELGL